MRIALFGGLFNPVHRGHLLIADAARRKYKLDRVFFLPAGIPPHKKRPLTPISRRLTMLRLATRGRAAFRINTWEARAKRTVYTYQTVEHFKKLKPRASLYFLLGQDAMKAFPRWRNPDRIRTACELIPFKRIPRFASHDIRARVYKGQPIGGLVAPAVERYIRQHRLYRRPE